MLHDTFPRRLYNKNGKTVKHDFIYINCRVARVGSLENRCRSEATASCSLTELEKSSIGLTLQLPVRCPSFFPLVPT